MSDLWIYVDESGQEDATFRVGALATEAPLAASLAVPALASVAKRHPGNPALHRGFHAKDDSPRMRKVFFDAIRAARLDAVFVERIHHLVSSPWIGEVGFEAASPTASRHPPSGHPYLPTASHVTLRGRALQEGLNECLLHYLLDSNCDVVHLSLEERSHVVTTDTVPVWATNLQSKRLGLAAANPLVPFRFPPLHLQVVSKSRVQDPGLQVCDYLLWAVQRTCNAAVAEASRWDSVHQAGLNFGGAFTLGGPWVGTERRLGRGISNRLVTPLARTLDDSALSPGWLRYRTEEIATIVRGASALASEGHPRIGHLATLLREVSSRPLDPSTVPLLGSAFLLLCDTLPVYDPSDGHGYFDVCHRRAVAGMMCQSGDWWSPVRDLVEFAVLQSPS